MAGVGSCGTCAGAWMPRDACPSCLASDGDLSRWADASHMRASAALAVVLGAAACSPGSPALTQPQDASVPHQDSGGVDCKLPPNCPAGDVPCILDSGQCDP